MNRYLVLHPCQRAGLQALSLLRSGGRRCPGRPPAKEGAALLPVHQPRGRRADQLVGAVHAVEACQPRSECPAKPASGHVYCWTKKPMHNGHAGHAEHCSARMTSHPTR